MREQNITRGKTKRPGKDSIIAFRLETQFRNKLDGHADLGQVEGIKSTGDRARKIVMDFILGRLVYPDPAHRSLNPSRSNHLTGV